MPMFSLYIIGAGAPKDSFPRGAWERYSMIIINEFSYINIALETNEKLQ